MIQKDHPQPNQEAIEALKAATRQVVQPAPRNENPGSPTVASSVAHRAPGEPKQKLQSMPASENFAEAFVQKLTSIEKETAEVDEEMANVEKLWSSLVEKKKQLENRRNELTKVKDKITTLNKEMDDVLSKELGVRNYLVL